MGSAPATDEHLKTAVAAELQREITPDEAKQARQRLLRRALGWTALFGVAYGIDLYQQAAHPSRSWWLIVGLWFLALPFGARRLAREYTSITPRPTRIVDQSLIESTAAQSRLCSACKAVIPKKADTCPRCGEILRTTPMVLVTTLVLLLIVASIVWKNHLLW